MQPKEQTTKAHATATPLAILAILSSAAFFTTTPTTASANTTNLHHYTTTNTTYIDDDREDIDLTSMTTVIDGQPRIIAEGFRFLEGPLWIKDPTHPGGGRLLFCDLGGDAVFLWTPHDVTLEAGDVSEFRNPSDRAAGAALAPNGDVILTHFGRTLSAQDDQDNVRTIASTVGGKRLNSPNDLTIHTNGTIYFTDPAFSTRGPAREIDIEGVYL